MKEAQESDAAVSISSAFGGGEIMVIVSQNLSPKTLKVQMVTRKKDDR